MKNKNKKLILQVLLSLSLRLFEFGCEADDSEVMNNRNTEIVIEESHLSCVSQHKIVLMRRRRKRKLIFVVRKCSH